uniref:Uncharacterized protein n=2 Tax=Cacopsylla melanoneura TaxID=428564 RepID=A0A8D9BTT6_9HEMI
MDWFRISQISKQLQHLLDCSRQRESQRLMTRKTNGVFVRRKKKRRRKMRMKRKNTMHHPQHCPRPRMMRKTHTTSTVTSTIPHPISPPLFRVVEEVDQKPPCLTLPRMRTLPLRCTLDILPLARVIRLVAPLVPVRRNQKSTKKSPSRRKGRVANHREVGRRRRTRITIGRRNLHLHLMEEKWTRRKRRKRMRYHSYPELGKTLWTQWRRRNTRVKSRWLQQRHLAAPRVRRKTRRSQLQPLSLSMTL